MLLNPPRYKYPLYGLIALSTELVAFRLIKTAAPNETASVVDVPVKVTYNVTEFDTHTAVSSSIFTVPAAANGRPMQFSSGIYFGLSEQPETSVQVSTNGGGSWSFISRYRDQNVDYFSAITPLVKVTTGHQYRSVLLVDDGSANAVADALGGKLTHFSGHTVK